MRPGPKARAAAPCSQTAAEAASKAGNALRGEAGDEAGQHVAGAGGGERRRQVPADRGAAVGRGDDRVGALEHDDRAGELRRRPRARELVVLGVDAPGAGEEPREFALVRRHDDGVAAALDQRRQLPASPAKLVSASASSTIVRPFAGRVSAAATSLRKSGPTPAPGPSAIARRRSSASSASKPCGAGEGRDHDRGQMRGVDGDGVERACDRNDARAGAQRRPRREPRRARLMRRAGEDERGAARIFVRHRRPAAAARRARGPAR